MITPMKKVTIICLDSDKQASLERLREMGILHITPLKNPTGSSLNAVRNDLLRVQKALESIPDVKKAVPLEDSLTGEGVVEEVQRLLEVRKNAEDAHAEAEANLSRYGVFGNLDPKSVKSLEERGIFVRLYATARGIPFETEDEKAVICPFAENADGLCYAVLNQGAEPAKVKTPATRIPIPAQSVEYYRQERSGSLAELAKVEKRFQELSAEKPINPKTELVPMVYEKYKQISERTL